MSGTFKAFIAVAVIGLIIVVALWGLWAARRRDTNPPTIAVPIGATIVAAIIAAIPLMVASATIVPTRSIGVVTTFGKPTGRELSNGLHFVAPWSKVAELDGAIQIDRNVGKDALTARLGNNSNAEVDITVQWRLKPAAADKLFLDYKSFDGIHRNLVERQVTSSLNDTMSQYNPIEASDANADNDNSGRNDQLAAQVLTLLRQRTGNEIDFSSVTIPILRFDQATQDALNRINTQRVQTTIAKEQEQTNIAQSKANNALAASVANPNVIVSQCLRDALAKGISPLGCWPGTAAVPTVPAR